MFNVSKELGEEEVETCYKSYIVTKPTTSYIVNSIVGCVVNAILFVVGSFLNALVIYIFWKTPHLRNKVSYFVIIVLSSIDILVTLVVHPAHLVMSIAEIVGKAKCVYKTFYHITTVTLSGMSFLTFFVMNVERYLSIVHPMFHFKHITKFRCFIACSVFWSIAIICGPVAYPLHLNIQIVITIMALMIMFGTFYIYIAIFCIARKRRRALQDNERKREENPSVFLTEKSSPTEHTRSDNAPERRSEREIEDNNSENVNRDNGLETNKKTSKVRLKKQMSFLHDLQLAKMYLLVVFSTFLLNIPNAVGLALYHDTVKTVNGWVQFKIWSVTLVLMNSTVNSLIFFWANVSLRKEGWKLCKRFLKR